MDEAAPLGEVTGDLVRANRASHPAIVGGNGSALTKDAPDLTEHIHHSLEQHLGASN